MALAREGGPKLEISIENNQAFCRFFLTGRSQQNGSLEECQDGQSYERDEK